MLKSKEEKLTNIDRLHILTVERRLFMEILFFIGLLFVILFSVILQLFFKNPYIVTGIILVFSLMIFAIFFDTLGIIFLLWIIIYTILAFITSLITCKYAKGRNINDGF